MRQRICLPKSFYFAIAYPSANLSRLRGITAAAIRSLFFTIAAAIFSGCAVHYYDQETNTENLFGIGHFQMKVAPQRENVIGIVSGISALGLSLGTTAHGAHFGAGLLKEYRLSILQEDASVRLEWPNAEFFSVRVGSTPPFLKEPNPTYR